MKMLIDANTKSEESSTIASISNAVESSERLVANLHLIVFQWSM